MDKASLYRRANYILSGILVLCFAACSNTKYLPAGESLYTGSKVVVKSTGLKKKQKKVINSELLPLTRPKPNSSVLGLRIKLYAWNIAGKPKKKRSPAAWLKRKFGEPPVLLSTVNIPKNENILDNTMENKGYFQVQVNGDSVVKKRRATAVYTVQPNVQYTIREVIYPDDSTTIGKSIRSSATNSLLKVNKPFNLDEIKAEYTRVDGLLKENGYYYFNPDFLLTKADSTIGNNQVNLYVTLKPGVPAEAKKIFSIKDVFVYSQYSLNAPGSDTSKKNAKFYKGYYVIDRRNLYKPRLFQQALQFNPGDVYSRTEHNLSLNRLINLGLFKFVKNRFENISGDSSLLNTYYYLTPLPKQSLRLELGAENKSNNITGTSLTLSWRNRNFFKGGELLTLNASGGVEVQYSATCKGCNIYRAGFEANLAYPRFLIPFVNINTRSGFIPKTNILLAYDALNKIKFYTLNSFRGSFGYSWKESPLKEHQFNPISINYVQPWNVSQQYIDSIKNNYSLQRTIDKQFIIGSMYNYNYNQLIGKQPANGFYFNGNLDLSGNIAGLITGADYKKGDSIKIFGALFAQYVKAEGDLRFYKKLSENAVWANRIIAGLGYPYGNSVQLPFIKQFFIGGNNSLRAFRSRSLGPGSYLPANYETTVKRTFIAEQSGDMKLELNTELRQKLFSIVQGAIFVDAGNIWLYNEDSTKPGAKFTKDFLKELAVGTGVGLRFDVTILVLRLDLAFPLRKPWLPDGERWVMDKISFGNPAWRKQNLVFNLAIGYPF